MKMYCPRCGSLDFEVNTDEVDNGVGIQRHIRGGFCADCGEIEYCDLCGEWDGKHNEVCDLADVDAG